MNLKNTLEFITKMLNFSFVDFISKNSESKSNYLLEGEYRSVLQKHTTLSAGVITILFTFLEDGGVTIEKNIELDENSTVSESQSAAISKFLNGNEAEQVHDLIAACGEDATRDNNGVINQTLEFSPSEVESMEQAASAAPREHR
jgi:hypothetical protein